MIARLVTCESPPQAGAPVLRAFRADLEAHGDPDTCQRAIRNITDAEWATSTGAEPYAEEIFEALDL